ncbi:ThiF family adenylyltransferase [Candidatus Saccharibacteria bacterium]|nr:ThiF family adenylyltransferase [Candidatus Saccharibacteria bacterium]
MGSKKSDKALEDLVKRHTITEVVDNYGEQYAELLLSRNAHLYRANYSVQVASIKDLLKEHYGKNEHWRMGSWAYFPWSQKLVHILDQTNFEELRTIRNRDLITTQEQAKLFDFEIACFGMSVGSANALAMAITGISRRIKLVDQAVISGSNLNRILTGVEDVGVGKATAIGRQIYEMNPYSSVEYYDKIDNRNAAAIFDKPWPIKLAIDEIDDLEMKIKIRVEAKKRRMPVLMASELGDTVVLDVERYDLEPDHELFHGLVPGVEELLNRRIENSREWMKHAIRILDPNNMPLKLQKSLLKIGSTIVTHPQLGSTVMMTGGVLAFAVKNIALGNTLRSGRYLISLENMLLADHQTRGHRRHHKKHTKIIKKAIESM